MASRTALPGRGVDIFTSAARAEATYNSDSERAFGRAGVRIYLDISAESGSATLDLKIQGKDQLSTDWVDVPGASFAQKSAVTSTAVSLTLYPGIAETANETVSDMLPEEWRVVVVIGGTSVTMTFTVRAELLA